jgi:vitamin B12 transporter
VGIFAEVQSIPPLFRGKERGFFMDRTRAGRASHSAFVSPLVFLLSFVALLLLPHSGVSQIEPIHLEGIIVTGTPVPRTVGTEASHVTILVGDELRTRGIARVTDALADVPGLVVIQNGSYGSVSSTFFRGAESDHVKVLLDGVEVNQAGGSFDFSGLLLSDVERIEVVRGPASALYGSDAMAGVINIISRRGQGSPEASLSARAGSYGRMEWATDVHGGSSNTSYSFSASRMSTDGILEFNNHFETTSLSGTVFLTPDEKTRIGLTGRYGDRVFHFPTDGSGNVVDRNAYSYGDETALGVEASRMMTDRLQLRAVLRSYGWDGGSDDQPDDASDNVGFFGYTSADAFQRTTVDLRANWSLPRSSVLSLGVEVEDENQRSSSESLSEYGSSTGQSRNRRSNRGYYAHLTTQASRWSGNVGGRLEDNEQYGDFFTYQAGLSYSVPSTGTRFRGNLGKGMKEPTFFETVSSGFSVGNPELNPELSRVWEVGVEQSFGESGRSLSLTWFDQRLEELIQYTFIPTQLDGPNYYNVAEARSRGLEVGASIPLGSLLLTGGYTYLDTEVLDAGFDEGDGATFVDGEALIRRPAHHLNLGGVYSFPRGKLSGGLRLVGMRFDRDFTSWPASPVELERYTLLSLGGELSLIEPRGSMPGFDLQFRAENLLDESYQEVFGFQTPGRAFLVGGRITVGR